MFICLQIAHNFFKATIGKCNVKKPGMMDFVGKAKWEAWNALEDISQVRPIIISIEIFIISGFHL